MSRLRRSIGKKKEEAKGKTMLTVNVHRYADNEYEYRHVQLPKQMLKAIPKEYFDASRQTLKLLWEEEWRGLGITQSLGWEHYEVHEPEPHILLFKYVHLPSTLYSEGSLNTTSSS
jgi:hypothetical protein